MLSVTAGKVNLTAVYDTESMLTWSLGETQADARTDGKFANDGTAIFNGDVVVIDRMTPGDVAKFKIDVTNNSNVGVQYRVRMISLPEKGVVDLTETLVTTAYIDGYNYPVTGTENATVWKFIDANAEINDIWVTVSFPNGTPEHDNRYQEAKAKMTFIVEAVQGNAELYEVSQTQDALFNYNGYLPAGIHNGEGATLALTTNEALGLNGTVTLANMTIDATNHDSFGMTIWDIDEDENNPEDSTLILANGTTIISKSNDVAIQSTMWDTDSFTLIVDETAKIVVSGSEGCAVLAQGWGTVVNIVLNDFDCIELKDGATNGFYFSGNDGETITVNMYVRNAAEKALYENMLSAECAAVNWFIDGTYYTTTYY